MWSSIAPHGGLQANSSLQSGLQGSLMRFFFLQKKAWGFVYEIQNLHIFRHHKHIIALFPSMLHACLTRGLKHYTDVGLRMTEVKLLDLIGVWIDKDAYPGTNVPMVTM